MTDNRFFTTAGPFTLGRLLFELGLQDQMQPLSQATDRLFTDVAALDRADSNNLSFFHNSHYQTALTQTAAGAVLVHGAQAHRVPETAIALIVDDPYRAFGQIATLFHPVRVETGATAIHPSAVVDETAEVEDGVALGPFVSVGAGAVIKTGSSIGAHCVIGPGVVIGRACVLEGHCTLSHTLIGDRVHIKAGARLGQGGFGWALDPASLKHQRIPQLGRVLVGNDVEIGANTTIDRGAGPDTVIGDGTLIDNQCQIAHNVRLGRGCAVAGRTAIAGSAVLEDGVLIGGYCAVLGHLTIGRGSQIHASSTVTKSCLAGSILRGVPARDYRLYLREEATLRRMARTDAEDAAQ